MVLYNKKKCNKPECKKVYKLNKGIFNEGTANDIFPLLQNVANSKLAYLRVEFLLRER